MLADSKGSQKSDPVASLAMTDDRHRTRLFILCTKTATDSELSEEFSQFGTVSHVQILTDKVTGGNKVSKVILVISNQELVPIT